jgi:hypothetical protein
LLGNDSANKLVSTERIALQRKEEFCASTCRDVTNRASQDNVWTNLFLREIKEPGSQRWESLKIKRVKYGN